MDWAWPNVKEVRRMNANAATPRTSPYLTCESESARLMNDRVGVNAENEVTANNPIE